MSVGKNVLQITIAGLFALLSVAAASAGAQAQQWDWGGSAAYGGGRKTVAFPKNYSRGEIIVSFGDRRLYYVTKRGVAISYPVAAPRQDARWQGVTNISMKKKNPPWRPTP